MANLSVVVGVELLLKKRFSFFFPHRHSHPMNKLGTLTEASAGLFGYK
jgi:hypothetical protein